MAGSTFAAAISVNGTCQVGACASPDVVSSGNSLSTAFNFTLTLPNSDRYRISGNINSTAGPAANPTFSVTSPFTVTYLGNAKGTSSAADVINLDVLQNFQLAFTVRNSTETAQGGFSGPLAAGSNVQVQLVIAGQALPVMGPFPAPANFSFKSQSFSINPPANPVQLDVHHIFTFAAGSGVGATIYNALTPPGSMGGGGNSTPPTACDASAMSDGTCAVIICENGSGSSLPISSKPRPQDSFTSSACTLVAENGGGSSLPILYPTGPSGASGASPGPIVLGSGCDVACDGSGSSLPILYPTGPTGASGAGVVIAEGGSGSSLPIFQVPGDSARATTAATAFPIEIITPPQSIATTYTVSATCPGTTAPCWITIPVTKGAIAASSRVAITAMVDPQGLAPGTYTANVAIVISPAVGESPSRLLNVPVTLALAAQGPNLRLSQTGLKFDAPSGATTPMNQTILVTDAGSPSLSFSTTVSTLSGNWLKVLATPGAPGLATIQANPTGLAPGVYSGLVAFTSPGAPNGTQSLVVTLTVSATGPPPSLSTNALVFVATRGSSPPAQTIQVFNPSSQTVTASTSIAFANGSGWFTASSSASTVTSAQPLTETIAVNSSALSPGVYLGSLDVHFAETNTDQLLAVLLVVKDASCTPTQLLPLITNLSGGFLETAGIPVPLQALIVDDCGTPLTSGAVMAYFPGGDLGAPLTSIGGGQWSGTWMPHSTTAAGPATVALLATSFSPPLYGSAGVSGSLAANPTVPAVFSGGIVNSANYADAPLAPGSRISIFGNNLSATPAVHNDSPYPTTLGGTQVLLGGEALPLQVSSSGLINAIVPYDLPIGTPQQLIVQQGLNSMPETVLLAAAQPAVFTQDQSGDGPGVILVIRPDGTYFENTPTNPAHAGDLLVIYCTGLGAVAPPVAAGLAAPLTPPSFTSSPVTVTIGGTSIPAAFAGLAPEFVTAYQVNVTVPQGIAPGTNIPLSLNVAGAISKSVTVSIQ
jgi:uncharacterized protein (TIGR03437 family)